MRNILRITLLVMILAIPVISMAQESPDSTGIFTNEYLDTVKVAKVKEINDYLTVGVNCGVTLSRMYFNPPTEQEWMYQPQYVSVMFTKYCKMFGYMPYFGMEAGFSYGKQGFRLKQDDESPYVNVVQVGKIGEVANVTEESMSVFKIPVRAKFHADAYPFRLMADLGIYAGWRTDISRVTYNPPDNPAVLNTFLDNENRFDYGMEGGVGIALVFDPIEFHIGALMGWSWSSIYEPDSRPTENYKYYYRYANPLDLMISFGIHFQLTKRSGRTNGQLKREAHRIVYGDKEDTSQDRE